MRRLVEHLRAPVHRNAYALVMTTFTSSGLGVLFWLIAARTYSESDVGLNSALVSAMLLLAGISHMGMKNGLIRFVPDRGASKASLIKGSYALAMLLAGAASLFLMLGLRSLIPEIAEIGSAPTLVLWVTLASMAWVIFQLQDSVLTGLRRATWVLVENAAYSIIKIVLLIGLAFGGYRLGIFAAWTIPLVAFVVAVNLLIFKRLIPASDSPGQASGRVNTRDVVRLAGADFLASLFWDAAILGLPLIVLARLGATANAHYFMAWSTAYVLYVVVSNVSQSFVVDAVNDPHRLSELARRALALASGLVLVMVSGLVAGGSLLLRIFGDSYSEAGATTLSLLAVSAIPYTLTGIYLGMARVEQRVRSILGVYVALSLSVLGLSLLLIGSYGITGVGMAWLAAQSAVAGYLLVAGFWKFWFPLIAPTLPQALLKKRRERRERAGSRAARKAVSRLPLANHEVHWARTSHDVVVAAVGPSDGPATEVLRIARSKQAERSIEANHNALRHLAGDPRIDGFRGLVPKVLSTGREEGHLFATESFLQGVPASCLAAPDEIVSEATRAIADLHERTENLIVADSEHLAAWLHQPAGMLSSVLGNRERERLLHFTAQIEASLSGCMVRAGWVHGDYTPGNLLTTPHGRTATGGQGMTGGWRVTGIVDWGLSSSLHLPEIDLFLLPLSIRVGREKRELGDIVVETLLADSRQLPAYPNDDLPWQTLLLMSWLHHVAGNLNKSQDYARNRLWLSRNVESVLMCAGNRVLDHPLHEPAVSPGEGP